MTTTQRVESFKDILKKHNLKNEVPTNKKILEVLKKICNHNRVGVFAEQNHNEVRIFMRDSNLSGDIGIVNLHPTKGTHWVLFINNYYFDSYGCPSPKNILKYIKFKYDKCIYSEYRTQKQDSLCASYCLYIIFLADDDQRPAV